MAATTANIPATSANIVHEQDRRRRQTIERAKATHLSRQLQLRLQYARLKVDHGWQKQNLNEVENLYFHHSQVRGTQPYPSPSLLATTQREGSPTVANGSLSQSTVSFRLGASPLSRTQTSATTATEPLSPREDPQSQSRYHTPAAGTPILAHNSTANTPRPSITVADLKSLIQMDTDDDIKRSMSPMNPPGPSTSNSLQRTDTLLVSTGSPTSTWSSTSQPNVNVPPSPGYYSRMSKPQSSTSTTDSSRSFASAASLTYDNFWSSHSSSTATSSFRGSTSHILSPPTTPSEPAGTGSPGSGLSLVWESSSFASGAHSRQSPARSRAPRSSNRSMTSIAGQEPIAAT